MKKIYQLFKAIIPVLALSIVFACGGSREEIKSGMDKMPNWWSKVEPDSTAYYAKAIGESTNIQSAMEKAELSARGLLSRQVLSHVENLQKSYRENENEFQSLIENLSKSNLAGSKIIKDDVYKEGNKYRYFVLMMYPVEKIMKEAKFKKNKEAIEGDLDKKNEESKEVVEKINET